MKKQKGTWKRCISAMLAVVLLLMMPGTVSATQKAEWRYGDSIHVIVSVDESKTFSPEDFQGVDCEKVFVLSKYRSEAETGIFYELVLMLNEDAKVEEEIEKAKKTPIVVKAEKNTEFVMKHTKLTLNQGYLYLPVGGTADVSVKDFSFGRNSYYTCGIQFRIESAYISQIEIKKDCFAQYGVSRFWPQNQDNSTLIIYPNFRPEELESQKSDNGRYLGLAGEENENLFDTVALLAAAPEVEYVSIVRSFTVGEEADEAEQNWNNQLVEESGATKRSRYQDNWSMDNGEIAGYTPDSNGYRKVTVSGLKPGVTTFNWERCDSDMCALKKCPVIVYEPGSTNNPGDLNHSGKITGEDALQALKQTVGLVSLDEDSKQMADLNADKKVDAEDALLMLKIVVKSL